MPERSSWSTTATLSVLLRWLPVAGASACQQDFVYPGFYAAPDAGPARTIPRWPEPKLGATAGSAAAPDAPLAGSGNAGAPSAGSAAMPSAGAGGTSGAAAGAGGSASDPDCDMTGRWIVTHHDVVDGLGQLQTAHSWKYYEIEQQGERLIITRGLHCGDDVVANTLLAANADMRSAWPGTLANNDYREMSGTSRSTADGCEIAFDKHYTIIGATADYYRDPAHPLPTPEQRATATTPGWEDWDNDGHPGVSLVISGAVTGSLYMASRTWHQLTARVRDTNGPIWFPDSWNQESAALGYDGSPLLTEQGVRAADMSLHFAEAARLEPTQAQGDDAATCAAVRMLAKTLTPQASQN